MIVYGHRSVKLTAQNLFNVSCPSCGQKSTTEMYVFGKYAHVFWIPFFPLGKVGVSQCEHCKAVLKEKEMNTELKEELTAMKAGVKAPKWQFSGLALLVVLFAIGAVSASADSANNKKFIADPKPGDKYYYKTGANYSIERVANVTADSVELELNTMEFTKRSGLYKIDKPQNYDGYTEMLSKKDLQQQLNDGIIFDVKR